MGRFGLRTFCGGLCDSLRPLHSTLIRRVLTGYGRHRLPYALTVTIQLETNGASRRHIDAAPIGRKRPCVDVGPHLDRPPDKPRIDAERPAAARRPLHGFGIFELLGHGAHQRTQTSQPGAKNSVPSKLPVARHDLWPHQRSRGGTRWLEAHMMRNPRTRHGKALQTARTHVWDVTEMDACSRRACI